MGYQPRLGRQRSLRSRLAAQVERIQSIVVGGAVAGRGRGPPWRSFRHRDHRRRHGPARSASEPRDSQHPPGARLETARHAAGEHADAGPQARERRRSARRSGRGGDGEPAEPAEQGRRPAGQSSVPALGILAAHRHQSSVCFELIREDSSLPLRHGALFAHSGAFRGVHQIGSTPVRICGSPGRQNFRSHPASRDMLHRDGEGGSVQPIRHSVSAVS
jgi:hypothetical protein